MLTSWVILFFILWPLLILTFFAGSFWQYCRDHPDPTNPDPTNPTDNHPTNKEF